MGSSYKLEHLLLPFTNRQIALRGNMSVLNKPYQAACRDIMRAWISGKSITNSKDTTEIWNLALEAQTQAEGLPAQLTRS